MCIFVVDWNIEYCQTEDNKLKTKYITNVKPIQ